MVGAQNIGMNLGIRDAVIQILASNKVVNPPTGVAFTGSETVTPPRVNILLFRVKVAEGVGETGVELGREVGALFVGKTSVMVVTGGILQVNDLVGDVEVTAVDDRFLSSQLAGVFPEGHVKALTEIQTLKFGSGVGTYTVIT